MKNYDDSLYSELTICVKQISLELYEARGYFSSQNDYDGAYLLGTEQRMLKELDVSLQDINYRLLYGSYGPIRVPNGAPVGIILNEEMVINPILKQICEQRPIAINHNAKYALPFGEFYGYTVYNILHKNYNWINYALNKYAAENYGCNEYQNAIDNYFKLAFDFYMRFESA